jgi:hypothetical protein
VSYYLVRTAGDDDRPAETAKWVAKSLAVTLHAEVAARPWVVHLEGDNIIDDPKAWARYNTLGNPVAPEEEEGQTDV